MDFASDNHAGVHPEVLEALVEANNGYEDSYGADTYSHKAREICKSIFGTNAELFQVFNGTSANIMAIEPLLDRYGAVVCSDDAHLTMDETGAPERILGNKIYPAKSIDGKASVSSVEEALSIFGDEHRPIPQVLSITQASEYGTVYTIKELEDLKDLANKHSLKIHIDGSRYANACASLDTELKAFVEASGASSLSLGMNKNGGMFGENVIIFDKDIANNFLYRRKNAMQLNSKMRFLAAQFIAFYENDLWIRNASQANRMAKLLHESIKDISEIEFTQQIETNAVFAKIPEQTIKTLQDFAPFYEWRPGTSEVRWMCSWQTTEDEVKSFATKIKETIKG